MAWSADDDRSFLSHSNSGGIIAFDREPHAGALLRLDVGAHGITRPCRVR